jgi:hypothetical protein
MRRCRWLMIGPFGLTACLLAGCLRATLPPETHKPQSNVSAHVPVIPASETPTGEPTPSDYLVSRTPTVRLDVQTSSVAENSAEKGAEKPVEPVDLRIQSEQSSSPARPPEPQPNMEAHAAPLTRPDAPAVQVLRALLEHLPEDEINEHLKSSDPLTREAILRLSTRLAQLQESGGIPRMKPRDLADWVDGLDSLTASLRGRAQLILERMCFCSHIENFGDFSPLPSDHTCFQPGEVAHVYVQVRNFSSRRERDRFATVLKGRIEIYDENNRDAPPIITWNSPPRQDASAAPRQDYYINFRVPIPVCCPSGLYTMRITVEDLTDALANTKQVPESRIARRTIDFRVGGPMARPVRAGIAESTPSP